MKCGDCKFWVEAHGTEPEEGCGGCTFTFEKFGEEDGVYYPMFLHEECALIEPYKTEAIKANQPKEATHE